MAKYLAACHQTRATGLATGETAFYPALQKLLESAGGGLKPRVSPVMSTRDQGAAADAGLLFHHAVAVLHAPRYAAEHADALRQDWPRVPLPATRGDLEASAALGKRVATLLDPPTTPDGVTSGVVGEGFKCVADPVKLDGSSLDAADLEVTARWGSAGQGGATMPGPGKSVARAFTAAEAAALGPAAVERLGPDTLDVYLNATTFWRNVPRAVWEYKLGGYQVLKKWLSYREKKLLGRGLTVDEVRHVRGTARRIAALLLLGDDLDRNCAAATPAGAARATRAGRETEVGD